MNKTLGKLFLKALGIFLVFEVIIRTLGVFLARGVWNSIKFGRYTSSMVAEVVVLVLALCLVVILKKQSIFGKSRLKFGKSILLCVPLVVISVLIFGVNALSLVSAGRINMANLVSLIIYAASIGLFEEIFFRGIIQGELVETSADTRRKAFVAILLSGFIFGAVHLTNILAGQDILTTIMQVFQTMAIGVLLGTVYFISKNIWALAFLHGFYDFAVLLSDVNYIKDCGLGDHVTMNVAITTIVASTLLSIIYIIYAIYLFRKSNIYPILNKEISEEEKLKERKTNALCITLIWGVLVILLVFNATSTYLFENDVTSSYECVTYKEKSFAKKELHFFDYDEYTFKVTSDYADTLFSLYIKNNNLYIKNLNTNDVIKLNKDKEVLKVAVYDNQIIYLATSGSDYYLYVKNLTDLSDINDKFKKYEISPAQNIGYLYDADNDIKYPMVESTVHDLFVVEKNKMYIVKK